MFCFVCLLWCLLLDFYLGALFNCFESALMTCVRDRIFTYTHILATEAIVCTVTVSCVCWNGWPRLLLPIQVLFIHAAVMIIQYCLVWTVSCARSQIKEATKHGCKGLIWRLSGMNKNCFSSGLFCIFHLCVDFSVCLRLLRYCCMSCDRFELIVFFVCILFVFLFRSWMTCVLEDFSLSRVLSNTVSTINAKIKYMHCMAWNDCVYDTFMNIKVNCYYMRLDKKDLAWQLIQIQTKTMGLIQAIEVSSINKIISTPKESTANTSNNT